MASYESILEQVCDALQPFRKPGQPVSEETDLVADLGLDSLKVMDLLAEVEDRFDISVPLNVLPEIRTVGDLARQLERVLEGA